jgi:hypothetical protein
VFDQPLAGAAIIDRAGGRPDHDGHERLPRRLEPGLTRRIQHGHASTGTTCKPISASRPCCRCGRRRCRVPATEGDSSRA